MECKDSVYIGRGSAEMFDDYMDFINYVFGFNGSSSDFKKLLPKLYKYEYAPALSSYVAVENGRLKAAVGAFDHDLSVCGVYLKTRGIGNVAVHPYSRGKGYMKELLNTALRDMIEDGVVLSALGGRRQRYNYFSYDKLGQTVSMSFNDDNIRHTFGKDRKNTIKLKQLEASDTEAIKHIARLSEAQGFHAVRDNDRYFEILSSWKQRVFVGTENDAFVGYAVLNGSTVNELLVTDESCLPRFVCALYDHLRNSSLQIKLPIFLPGYIDALIRICEFYDIEPCKSFTVLNYKPVVSAFMRLKSTYTQMPSGSFVFEVDGMGGRERLKLEVISGEIKVEASEEEPEAVLSHLEAMNLLFAPVSVARERLPAHARAWLPLPIYLYASDAV